ncbi:MAG: ABC transporter substrate-binding protein [Lachnospiraceae bacterium]|nr:ABC transporter substrate-binding protein [Lachnospiraceae bacterium]
MSLSGMLWGKTERIKRGFWPTVFVTMCSMLLSACGITEEEIPMGRYADREVTLPGAGYEYMHPCADGGYYLFGNEADLTHVAADGAVSREKWGWEANANIHVKFSYGISDDGAVIFGYVPMFYSDEEYEAYAAGGDNRYLYYYVSGEGERYPLELFGADYQKATNLETFSFAPDGRVYAASDSCVYRIHVESGETESLFATAAQVREFAFVGSTMLALDGEKAYLYDMAGEKLLSDNSVLNEFVKSHQSGRIVLAAERTADAGQEGGSEVLYLACRTGLYRYVWGGSVIEQIADGQMTALGDSQYNLYAMQILEDGQFRVYFSGNYMVEMYYDETLPMKPSKELTVYSLEENGRIRYAGRLFQKEHPDVLVRYETGMDGDNAVSREDALKNLNTRILAGDVPDVMILDDMDMEQYADKGMLRELDDFLAPYREEDILYGNIVDGMRMTEKNRVYGVPMTVELPLYYGEKKYVEDMQGLEGIVAGAEAARKEHEDGPLIDTPYQSNLFDLFIPLCLPAWTNGDGSLNTGSLEEFYQKAERLWELDSAGMSEEERRRWQQDVEDEEADLSNIMFGQYEDIYNIGETWIALGYLKNAWYGMTNLHTKMENYRNGYSYYKRLEDEVVCGRMSGQAGNVYRARTIVGLCEKAEEPELGEAFMELLLSDTMMQKWWLEGHFDGGIPIRKESLASLLDIHNRAFAEVKGWTESDINMLYKEAFWPTEEEVQRLFDAMEESDCCYRAGTLLEETVREVGVRVLDGGLTPEEGAKEVERKMAIAMEE